MKKQIQNSYFYMLKVQQKMIIIISLLSNRSTNQNAPIHITERIYLATGYDDLAPHPRSQATE